MDSNTFKLTFLLYKIFLIAANGFFTAEINVSVTRYSYNFKGQYLTSKLNCKIACLKFNDCSYAVYINNSICELYNRYIYTKKSSESIAFVRRGSLSLLTMTNSLKSDSMSRNGQTLVSQDGTIFLIMQTDGNLVLYNFTKPLWYSNTYKKGKQPYYLNLKNDENLFIYDSNKNAIWATNHTIRGYPPHILIVQNDGNAEIYDNNGTSIWSII
ncbi:unnamed protein product [Brachionus calyciflorus]|uniref:Bulb-type lectin domain-containing protein n=1 Tax=Brachionus calyciflorus TaxID=104777 RepID=A0A814ILE7_9BILA|nr:unnamed protein product [Brachionus calyciflorus]